MNTTSLPRSLARPMPRSGFQLATGAVFVAALHVATPAQAQLALGNNPLYLVSGKANVLVILDNSNSMDEAPDGSAKGSNSPSSKSEIARGVVRTLTDNYKDRINMGLMSYRQNSPNGSFLHNSPYDVSYSPATYNDVAPWKGARDSATNKGNRITNPSSTSDYIYYNVALPFYAGSSQGNGFCYSATANASNNFKDGENAATGPWDTYRCFRNKTGIDNTLPTWGDAASEASKGFSGLFYQGGLSPTDSDFAQGILDFGKHLTWNYVGRTWLRNDSPGRGYLNVPIGALTTAQGNTIKTSLACNIPGDPTPCTNTGLKNAGLTPIEGTLLTAKDYFGGSWSNSGEGYTSSCYPLPNSCGKDYVILVTDGLPSTDKNGGLVADPAAALSAAIAAAAELKAAGIETYVIGFALPNGVPDGYLDPIAAAGGTKNSYTPKTSAELDKAFLEIFNDVFSKTSSFGSVSQNSTAINADSRIYQGRFDSTDWSGELEAIQPGEKGALDSKWNTNDAGLIAAPGARKVFTITPGGGGTGVGFKLLSSLAAAQQTALRTTSCGGTITDADVCAQARIDWIRGDKTNEQKTAEEMKAGQVSGPLRRRSKVLGDIISSSPFYARDTNTVYVGANDGMLHAFDAKDGKELFAYVPNAVIPNLYKLTAPSYSHEYFVDGEITVSNKGDLSSGKNILVGTLGRGGKTVYALDVSDPANFSASKVMWEYTEADMGLSLGKPFIAKLNNGKTAVLIGNGYNSTSGRAVLYVIDIETGLLIRKLDTVAGSVALSNGMTTPRGWDRDGNGTLDLVYVGDRLGNLWKFDLSSSSAASWAPALGTVAAPVPLFVAKDAANKAQPITGGISLGINSRKGDTNFGKLFVFFGTGQYMVTPDVTDKSVQTWYGLIDSGTQIPDRSVLQPRTIIEASTIAGNAVRVFSSASTGDMAGKRGWYLDLVPPSGGAPAGERITSDAKFLGSVLLVTSLIPTDNICDPGGNGFLNAIDPFTGGNLSTIFFDANGDNEFVVSDSTKVKDTLLVNGKQVPVGSISPGNNLPSEGILIGDKLITSGTSGNVRSIGAKNPIRTGRISWREIVRQN